MFRVVSPENWNLEYFALIQICEDGTVRLMRTLNPCATDGVQGEEYGEEWEIQSRISASGKFRGNGFWKTWTDINGQVCGGIGLHDGLCDEEVGRFLGMCEHPFVFCNDDNDAADAVLKLRPGFYLFYVPTEQ